MNPVEWSDAEGEPFEFPEDVSAILGALEHEGRFPNPREVESAWRAYSESVMAGWIDPGTDPNFITRAILPFLP